MRIQKHLVLGFAIALTIISAASAQGGNVPDMPSEVGVTITLQVAGQPFRFQGKAKCEYVPVASIENVVAEKWTASLIEPNRSMGLTLWRPKNRSGDMFSLHVLLPAKGYIIDTVRRGGEGSVAGSGKVTLKTSGAGGTFTIHATARDGAVITGTIQCSAFTDEMPEGG
jgi:hypothetical protein